jgi:SAM-dependent methyltransferase
MYYAFSLKKHRLLACQDCGYLGISPQPGDEELAEIYGRDYVLLDKTDQSREQFSSLKRATASHYLDLVARYRGTHGGRLLEIGCGRGDLLAVAVSMGYEVTGVEYSPYACAEAKKRVGSQGEIVQGELDAVADRKQAYDVCILSDVIEHVRDPRAFLQTIHSLLAPGGIVFIAAPSMDSWSARVLKNNWMEFKTEHLHYFSQNTLHSLLFQTGFHRTVPSRGIKTLSMAYILDHFEKYPIGWITNGLRTVSRVIPRSLKDRPVRVVASGMIAIASRAPEVSRRKLSIVLPAFNEARTLPVLLDGLLARTLEDIDREIILVESNSTDGTREIAMRYQQHPDVKLVLEDRPRGKGHAVRTGLAHATGDFILIQDADLEYDLDDYDVLLEPLTTGRRAFVLGSRHGGKTLKLRSFAGQPLLSSFLNGGHWFFRTILNVLYGVRLKDPFTMYKVFRRDCLSGLRLECNRFDLDYEIVIKLIRKGYRALEIPVNYRSRSFTEGKKVSILRDPLTWLWALIKFRVQPLDLFQSVELSREQAKESPAAVPATASVVE